MGRTKLTILRGDPSPVRHRAIRKRYCKFVDGSSSVFFWLVNNYYNHSFRELFLNGTGPCNVHGAVIGILAGNVFPKPAFALRWRLKLFELCMRIHKRIALVPRRTQFSLLDAPEAHATAIANSIKPASTIEMNSGPSQFPRKAAKHGAANH